MPSYYIFRQKLFFDAPYFSKVTFFGWPFLTFYTVFGKTCRILEKSQNLKIPQNLVFEVISPSMR